MCTSHMHRKYPGKPSNFLRRPKLRQSEISLSAKDKRKKGFRRRVGALQGITRKSIVNKGQLCSALCYAFSTDSVLLWFRVPFFCWYREGDTLIESVFINVHFLHKRGMFLNPWLCFQNFPSVCCFSKSINSI